jgi:NB-ARC domain
LPASETHGVGELDIVGNAWSNLPSVPVGYIRRLDLENEIASVLTNDRHPIVTLVGRGGIGKTSLALRILHEITLSDRFEAVVWFSARDIDLLPQGPKTVRPQVLTQKDISSEFVTLMGCELEIRPGRSALDVMSDSLRKSHLGGPILFVFDNFETIRNPVDVFNWLDSNIRLPNKILITSRFREFKADYPIEIGGMGEAEANQLISQTAVALGIDHLITVPYRAQLFEESDGHPYVIKIMLGEVADSRKLGRPKHVVARKVDVLDALFERTFANLSPLATRLFMTLSGWRSLVPQLALEAVVLRDQSEQLDAAGAVDELVRMSLAQRVQASDGSEFLDVPLAAAIFGARKLAVSPLKLIIENDIRLLQDLGSTSVHTLREGVHPRIKSLFTKISARISEGRLQLEQIQSVLEFIARSFPPAWLLLADLHEELHGFEDNKTSAEYVRRYIEQVPDGELTRAAWERLSYLYRRTGDIVGACGAFVHAFDGRDCPLAKISNMANWVNTSRDAADKKAVFGALGGLMERRIGEASATDLSRLAWLHLHAGDVGRARQVAEMGLEKESGNRYCETLIERLSG